MLLRYCTAGINALEPAARKLCALSAVSCSALVLCKGQTPPARVWGGGWSLHVSDANGNVIHTHTRR